MNIANIATSSHARRYNSIVSNTYSVQGKTETATSSSATTAAKTAAQAGGSAAFATAKVSDAVGRTLLLQQETGSVFDSENIGLMNSRGVSDETRERFAQIIQEAVDNNAYDNPIAYVQSLSAEDVEVLRQVHCLAEKSGVTGVSTTEGAINLLLPPQEHVDINNDGLVSNGTATLFQFPPPNAPQSVKDAWEEMSKDMTLGEKLEAQIPFMVASISANIKYDGNGTPVGLYEPGDPEYTNVFGTTEAEWDQLLDKLVSRYADLAKQDSSQQDRLDMLVEFASILDNPTTQTAASEEASATEDKKVVERINGVDVIVSGHSVDNRENVSLLQTYDGKITYTPEMYEQVFGDGSSASDGSDAANRIVVPLTSTMTEVSATAHEALPLGATSSYMNITKNTSEGRWERDLISTPIDQADAYYRQDLKKYMGIVDVERQLKAEYGDDVKLVYSHTDGGYIMLTPDDQRYSEMASAEEGVNAVLRDVRMGFMDAENVRDVLSQYGYRV